MNNTILRLVPGIALSAGVAGAAMLLERGESALFGRAWLESLVLAILLGSLVRTAVPVPAACEAGVRFAAKAVLELAVMLLGPSVSAAAIVAHGLPLLGGIALAVVMVAPTIVEDMNRGPSYFRRKDVFDLRSFSTTHLELTRGTDTLTLDKSIVDDKDVWKTPAGKIVETAKVEDLLNALAGRDARGEASLPLHDALAVVAAAAAAGLAATLVLAFTLTA